MADPEKVDVVKTMENLKIIMDKKNPTKFGAWNVRTLTKPAQLEMVCVEMERLDLDFLGLSECRWKGSGKEVTAAGHLFIYSGVPKESTKKEFGVGIILNKRIKCSLLDYTPISERVIIVRLNTVSNESKISIVQCYAPAQSNGNVENRRKFFEKQLVEIIQDIPENDIRLFMGDFNAQVGSCNMGYDECMGINGLPKQIQIHENSNGQFFRDWCLKQKLVIGGTIFEKEDRRKVSWRSPKAIAQTQVDHIVIDQSLSICLTDVRNDLYADIGSDHNLIYGEITLKVATNPTRNEFNIGKLNNADIKELFQTKIADIWSQLPPKETIEQKWLDIKKTYQMAASEVLRFADSKSKLRWISERTWEKIEERREAKRLLDESTDPNEMTTLLHKFNKLIKEVDVLIRVDYLAHQAEKGSEDSFCAKELYDLSKKLTTSRFSAANNENENFLVSLEDQAKRRVQTQVGTNIQTTGELIKTEPPTVNEIEEAIISLRNGTAPGVDRINIELLKVNVNAARTMIEPLLTQIWEEGKIPQGKFIRSVFSKILSHIILKRVEDPLLSYCIPEQAGFKRIRSLRSVNHINTIRNIIEQSGKWQSPLCLLFLQFEKASGYSLDHNFLWLVQRNVPEKILNLIKEIYIGGCGLKEDCILSPILLTSALDYVLEQATLEFNGVQGVLYKRKQLEYLVYEENTCLLAHNHVDMQSKLNSVVEKIEHIGLKIDTKHSYLLKVGPNSKKPINCNKVRIDVITKLDYLGRIFKESGEWKITETFSISEDPNIDNTADITNRVKTATDVFSTLRKQHIWSSKCIDLDTKLHVFNSQVKSVLLYGCETWNRNKASNKKIEDFVIARLLEIITPHTTKIERQEMYEDDLLKLTKQEPILKTIQRLKCDWIAPTLSKPDQDITRQALDLICPYFEFQFGL